MLDGDKLIEMIGHATINSPLDEFLKANGVKSRPKGNSGYYDIEDKTVGIYFSYYEDDNYSEKFFIPIKSRGNFILQGIIFRNKIVAKGGTIFSGKYPFGVNSESKPEDILKKFGKPKKFEEGANDSPDNYSYFSGMMIFSFSFNHQTKALECVHVYAADKYDRKHGLID
jgi:hypothetical protein